MTDVDELRALQRKAYGPGGGLSAAEASRLDALQERARLDDAPAGASEDAGMPHDGDVEAVGDDPAETEATEEEPEATGEPAAAAPSARQVLSGQWRVLLVAAIVVLGVGLGAGWMLFAPRPSGIELTEEQRERGHTFADSEDFDSGTLRAVGRDEDAVAWYGTKRDGQLVCLLLDVGGIADTECVTAEDVQPFALSTSVMAPTPATDEETDHEPTSVSAYLALSTEGLPMVGIHRWTAANSMLTGFAGEDRDRAEELLEEGYVASLSIIGLFGDQPVWLAERYTADTEPETCLIVDGADRVTQCAPSASAREDGISVVAIDGGRDPSRATVLTLAFTESQAPYLTITENVETTAIRIEGDRLEVGGEQGDPIEVRSDDPEG
jgi:hypothetical protein